MQNLNRINMKRLLKLALIFIFIAILVNGIARLSYAPSRSDEPDVVITIHENGAITYGENNDLFGGELFYPGKKKDGIIRIVNRLKKDNILEQINPFSTVKITSVGLKVELNDYIRSYPQEMVLNSFLNHMKLTLKKDGQLFFNDTILGEKKFLELSSGYVLENSEQFHIKGNDFADIRYTIYMDDEAGNELQNLEASVGFWIGLSE